MGCAPRTETAAGETAVKRLLDQPVPSTGHSRRQICRIAFDITRPKQNRCRYKQSAEVGQLREQAMRANGTPPAREVWKRSGKPGKRTRKIGSAEPCKRFQRGLASRALAQSSPQSRRAVWEEELTTQQNWEQSLRFAKPRNRQREQVWRQLERRCKGTRWTLFSKVELALRTATRAGSKSTGPDGTSYEALKEMWRDEGWEFENNSTTHCTKVDSRPKERQPKE